MSAEELRRELDKRLRKKLIAQIKKLDELVNSYVDDAAVNILCNAVGFTHKKWDDTWEVDHCNGRKSSIANALGERALKEVQLAIPDFVNELLNDPKLIKNFRRAAEREFKDRVRMQFRISMNEWAETHASEFVDRVLKDAVPSKGEQ